MFRGFYEHSMDGKGRVQMPARFRAARAEASISSTVAGAGGDEGDKSGDAKADAKTDTKTSADAALGLGWVVTTGCEACLVAYPEPAWRAFEERLASLPQFDPAVVRLKRLYVGGAVELVPDSQGRILLPPVLRRHAGLKKDVVWAGMVHTLEIWSPEAWHAERLAAQAEPEAMASALAALGL